MLARLTTHSFPARPDEALQESGKLAKRIWTVADCGESLWGLLRGTFQDFFQTIDNGHGHGA